MPNSENKLSREEATRLAFEGLFDKLGAAVLRDVIEAADKRMGEEPGLEGVYIPVDEMEPGDLFATTVQIEPDSVGVVFGGDDEFDGSEAYSLPRAEVAALIQQRLQEETANYPSA